MAIPHHQGVLAGDDLLYSHLQKWSEEKQHQGNISWKLVPSTYPKANKNFNIVGNNDTNNYYIVNPVLGKSLCSDWFFFGQDFAIRVFLFWSEAGKFKICNQNSQKKVWIMSFFILKLSEENKKIENFFEISKIDGEDKHF